MFGDPKIIIDWLNGLSNLQVISVKHWFQKIQNLINHFVKITFRNISRCFSVSTDSLSKEALSLNFGSARIQKFLEGKVTYEGEFDLKEIIFKEDF